MQQADCHHDNCKHHVLASLVKLGSLRIEVHPCFEYYKAELANVSRHAMCGTVGAFCAFPEAQLGHDEDSQIVFSLELMGHL